MRQRLESQRISAVPDHLFVPAPTITLLVPARRQHAIGLATSRFLRAPPSSMQSPDRMRCRTHACFVTPTPTKGGAAALVLSPRASAPLADSRAHAAGRDSRFALGNLVVRGLGAPRSRGKTRKSVSHVSIRRTWRKDRCRRPPASSHAKPRRRSCRGRGRLCCRGCRETSRGTRTGRRQPPA